MTQTSPTTATGIIADLVQVAVDYEFRRNIVVTVAGSRELDKFVADFRRDNVYVVESRLKYLLNSMASIALWHRYVKRESNIPTLSYDRQQVGINATARF